MNQGKNEMKNLDTNPNQKLKKGDKVQYTRQFMFGKTGTEVTTVVLVNGCQVLLQNGETIYC